MAGIFFTLDIKTYIRYNNKYRTLARCLADAQNTNSIVSNIKTEYKNI